MVTATVKIVHEHVVVEPPPTIEVKRIVLELSLAEAEFIRFIMERIGGDPCRSKRGISDSINRALCRADVPVPYRSADGWETDAASCCIYFS